MALGVIARHQQTVQTNRAISGFTLRGEVLSHGGIIAMETAAIEMDAADVPERVESYAVHYRLNF